MIENDKGNWKGALVSSIIVTIGSFLLMNIMGTFTFENWIILQPVLWFLVFLPIFIIELISRIQKRGRDDNKIKRS